jgi:hypothetical protein
MAAHVAVLSLIEASSWHVHCSWPWHAAVPPSDMHGDVVMVQAVSLHALRCD